MSVNLDRFNVGNQTLTLGGGGGAAGATLLVTTTTGTAGVDALDAQTPSAGDYGIIGLGTTSEVLLQYGTFNGNGGWSRPFPFPDIDSAAAVQAAKDSFVEQIPSANGWNTFASGTGTTIDYNTTVAGKVYIDSAAASDTIIVSTQTRTDPSVGAGFILRSVTWNLTASGSNNAQAGALLLNPDFGLTEPLISIESTPNKSTPEYFFGAGAAATGSIVIDPGVVHDLEVYISSSGRTVAYHNWASQPIYDDVVVYPDNDQGILSGFQTEGTEASGTVSLDSYYTFDFSSMS